MPGKPLSPKQIAAKLERERKAERKQNLDAMLTEHGIPIKTPEQRAADEERRQANPAKPLFRYSPPIWDADRVRKESGPYADTVLAFARADRLRFWACDGIDRKGNATANPSLVIQLALDFHVEQIWRDAGIVRLDRCALDNLTADSRGELEQVISDTFAEWEAAGAPGLDAKAYEFANRFMLGFIWKRSLPPYLGCPEPPPSIFPDWIPHPDSHKELN